MRQTNYAIERLEKHHDRNSFSCGVDNLDRYLIEEAGQYRRRNLAITYILTEHNETEVIGYYTLSATSINLDLLPEKTQKKLPRYPTVPATLLGRLAVDKKHQGKNIGEILLIDVLKRSFESSSKIGSIAVIVEAENDSVINFYKKYGFILLSDCKNKLFLPMKTIEQLWQ